MKQYADFGKARATGFWRTEISVNGQNQPFVDPELTEDGTKIYAKVKIARE